MQLRSIRKIKTRKDSWKHIGCTEFFFQSKAVEDLQKIYERRGFLDKTATFKNRYEKSIDYLSRAEVIATKRHDTNMIANIQYNKSFAYGLNGDMNQACKALASSLEINNKIIVKTHLKHFPSLMVVKEVLKSTQNLLSHI